MPTIRTAADTPAPRSESDVLLKQLTLTLGEKEYTVPVLRSIPAAKWRADYFKRTQEVTDALPMNFDEKSGDVSKAISRGLMGAMVQFPGKIPELIFSYAPSLEEHREEIEASTYDHEYSRAFAQIWQVAFAPFLGSLGMVMEMQRSQDSASRSSASSN